jgi:transcriptional regulator with XRE-family HTH domain
MPTKSVKAAAIKNRLAKIAKPELGANIRKLRRERGWKLVDLSRESGIAVSTLSKVENGSLSLTFDRLQLMAKAFDLSLSEFLSSPGDERQEDIPTARISWAHKGRGTELDTPGYQYIYLCENLRKKSMVPIISRCKARTLDEFGPLLKHTGEEFIFVFRGAIVVHTEFYTPQRLEEGEGVYIDSRMGHAYLSASEEEAWILSCNHNLQP